MTDDSATIPQAEADARLIALIKEHGKWAEPEAAQPDHWVTVRILVRFR